MRSSCFLVPFQDSLEVMMNVLQKISDYMLSVLDGIFMLSYSISGWSRGDNECAKEGQW